MSTAHEIKSSAFPLFNLGGRQQFGLRCQRLQVTEIWDFWDYIVKMFGRRRNTDDYKFMHAMLEQASYFYKAAETAPLKSQPLLYYYSFLNLAKIMINIGKWYGKGSVYQHGISTKVDSTTKLQNAEINISYSKKQQISVAGELLAGILSSSSQANAGIIKIFECLRFCVGVHRTYCETYSVPEQFYRLEDATLIRQGKELVFSAKLPSCDKQSFSNLQSKGYNILSQSEGYYLQEKFGIASYNVSKKELYQFANDLKSKGLWYYSDGEEYRLFISSDNSLKFCPEFIIYVIMFFLGSVTRYHPYFFDSLMSDKELWLISEFLKTQPNQFLYCVTSKLTGVYLEKSKTSRL